MMDELNRCDLTKLRLNNWDVIIKWEIEGENFYWTTSNQKFSFTTPAEADFTISCTRETLEKIASKKIPFFIAIWVTGDIQFKGSYGDAYRLGYIFLNDKRKRRVIFISHCWLNINTIFPEGAAFPGANTTIIKALLDCDVGIIQMPCPEYHCLGLEKYKYGEVIKDELRNGFINIAKNVISDIQDYKELGFDVVGILGMNPSPSCGVDTTKGKGTMLGTNRDTSEQKGSGIFIEELKKLLKENGLDDINIFGVRRFLPGEKDVEKRVEELKNYIKEA
jgi:predicted secreted protein/putative sterol carrier protein